MNVPINKRIFAAGAFTSLLATALVLTDRPAASQEAAQRRDFAAAYLEQKRSELAQTERNLGAVGRLQASTGLLSLLRARNPLRRERIAGGSAEQKAAVEDALLRTLASYLASIGFLPADVEALRRQNVDVLEAGRAVLLGSPSVAEQAAIAESIVLARIDGLAADAAPGDGYGSTLSVTVERSYKGSFAAGQTLRVRQISGVTPEGMLTVSDEIPGRAGQRYLLFLSPSLYETRTGGRGGYAVHQIAPYLVQNGTLLATTPGQRGHGTSLSDFEAAIPAAVRTNRS